MSLYIAYKFSLGSELTSGGSSERRKVHIKVSLAYDKIAYTDVEFTNNTTAPRPSL